MTKRYAHISNLDESSDSDTDSDFEYEEDEEEVAISWIQTTVDIVKDKSAIASGAASRVFRFAGKTLWVVATTAIMVGFPMSYMIESQNVGEGGDLGFDQAFY